MSLLDGLFTGLIIGFIFSLPAMIGEAQRPEGRMLLVVDVETFWGRRLGQYQVMLWSAVLHLGMSTLYGAFVPLLVLQGIMSPLLTLPELVLYSVGFNIFIGAIALPATGFGWFGYKEGGFVWLELLITHLLYGITHWILVHALFI